MNNSESCHQLVLCDEKFANKLIGKFNVIIALDEFWTNSRCVKSLAQKLNKNEV